MTYARWALGITVVSMVVGIGSGARAQTTTTSTTTTGDAAALGSGDAGTDASAGGTATADTTPTTTTTTTASTGSGTASGTTTTSTTPGTGSGGAAAPTPVDEDEHCENPPTFDPGSPRLDLSVGGGYAAYFVTWRQATDFNMPGTHTDGLYAGPLVRGEIELGLGAFSLSLNYTHIFSQHDGPVTAGTAANVDWALLSGEIGLQCACSGASYVWGFGLEVGWDLNNNTLFAGIEHRSQWFVWEGLFLGFDFDVAVLVGITSHGASGGAFEGSLFLGYSIG